jgi:hypothetical protein
VDHNETHIFISYSHYDADLVKLFVDVIRAVGGKVFLDRDSIPHGKRWRPVIHDSIQEASIVLVFWCEHSQRSEEVRKEWQFAIPAQKDVVPVLLDNTKMESELVEFQAVDFRSLSPVHAPTYKIPDSANSPTYFIDELIEKALKWLFGRSSETASDALKHGEAPDADTTVTAVACLLNYLKQRATKENTAL